MYTLQPEHEARFEEYRDRWIGHAMRTAPMTVDEREQCRAAVIEMYRLAGRPAPRVVFVASPIVAAMTAGCAAWIWHTREMEGGAAAGGAREHAAKDATSNGACLFTQGATDIATISAVASAVDPATERAARVATLGVTQGATRMVGDQATRGAVNDATRAALAATEGAADDATSDGARVSTQGETCIATNSAVTSAIDTSTHVATHVATLSATSRATKMVGEQATRDAVNDATRAALAATEGAADDATSDGARVSTQVATDFAVFSAKVSAVDRATERATHIATYAAIRAVTNSATDAAAFAATTAATDAATFAATDAATYNATSGTAYAATHAATHAATDAATYAAPPPNLSEWYVAPDVRAITTAIAGVGGVKCTALAYRLRQGGNQWAGWPAAAEWYREVAQLPIDWSVWMPWVTLAEHSGPRYVHDKFCVISDFPEVLKVDNANRPHCATGPFCRWRDGFALYAWHGIRVPAWIIEHPERVTIAGINAETNAEIRRVMIDRYGYERYLQESGAVEISADVDEGGEVMRLFTMPADDDTGRPMRCLLVANSTPDPDDSRRRYVIRVPPTCKDVWTARNWTFDLPPEARFDAVS
jgi:hypothetical protein